MEAQIFRSNSIPVTIHLGSGSFQQTAVFLGVFSGSSSPSHQAVIDLMDTLVAGLLKRYGFLLTCGNLGRAGV